MRIFQPTVTGSIITSANSTFSGNMSGSLTRLTDGTSYIIAGSGMTVTTGSTGAITVASTIPSGFATAIFGTGIDGDLTVADGATVTASKETYYNNLTIQGSGTFKPAGYRIFVRGTLTISSSGSFNDNGNNAVTSTQGAAFSSRGYLGGQTSAGGAGAGTAGNGTAAPSAFGLCPLNDSGSLASGGAGGTANARTGGAANTLTVMFASQGIWGAWQAGRASTTTTAAGNSTAFSGGGSGGSGGNDTGAGTISGAGGSGGGIVWIAAQTVANSGKISANGGVGGAATGAGNAGGGGGGGGGSVTLITNTPASSCGTVQALGGAGGAGVGVGTTGSAGTAGSTCIISFGGN